VTFSQRGLRFATAAVLVAVALSSSSSARAADPDPWLGKDKALHFAASGAIAAGGYTVGAFVFDARGHALVFGASLALAAGIAKEALDLTGLGDPSWKDLTWDVIGTATGVAAAWAIDLVVRGVSEKHPLLVAPRMDREGAALLILGRF
jgi:putative lipoprotein